MLNTTMGTRGMLTAPHHLAAQAGRDVLKEGGSAVEAMVTAAAVIAVVYPHMNAIGGDGFWLIAGPAGAPVGIDACGPAAAAATRGYYRERGHDRIPARGALAALTVPGTIAGWAEALARPESGAGRLPLARLLAPAVALAREGVPVTAGQATLTADKRDELASVPGFAEVYLPEGRVPATGERLRQTRLADTLERLGREGLDDFYRGELAEAMADDLARLGSPLAATDFARYVPLAVEPLSVSLRDARAYNMPPPTQGLASLMILGIYERLGAAREEGFAHVHALVEATKQAFRVRDAEVTDPAWMRRDAPELLGAAALERLAAAIDPARAAPWPHPGEPGDTVWLGAVDAEGRAASFIQSIYWEYGSGVVLPATGVLMQNRGISFGLDAAHPQALEPGRRPFHTLNPALAEFGDGRRMVYGTMGGEGQPQTQAAVFTRYAHQGQALQAAVTAPRWLLGRTWGAETHTLKLESRFPAELVEALRAAGHDVELRPDFDSAMGHAGAIVRHPDGLLEGAADPRSDGAVAAV
ncbi:gamma-glutamyltransferase [Spiribacter halobius]|uniref:Gamma-glutamyltransferase n=2 Tax=Sediminicurvatus halobius TaxID=2182432 RepID=A0A2U2N725_9GAMM|nr:gamma-glutamyltransferase [Spiribacter halobius]